MGAIEVVAIVSVILNVLCLGLLHSLSKDMVAQKLLTAQFQQGIGNIAHRMAEQGAYLQKVGNTLTEFTNVMDNLVDKISQPRGLPPGFPPQMGTLYRTLDGKYAAQTLEDLIDKIKEDGNEENYLSEEEMNGLRKLFEDDDDDESDFDPKKDKF